MPSLSLRLIITALMLVRKNKNPPIYPENIAHHNLDIPARAFAVPLPIPIPTSLDQASPATLEHFETLMETKDRPPVRVVILTNPHNPLGFCYPKETIVAYMKFCEKWDLHLFVFFLLIPRVVAERAFI